MEACLKFYSCWTTCADGTQVIKINKDHCNLTSVTHEIQQIYNRHSFTAFLAACGGGGGGDPVVSGGGAITTTTASLTSANQTVAAQEAVSTAMMPLDLAQNLTGAQTIDESALFRFALAQQKMLPAYLLNASKNSTLVGAVQTETVNCTYGGSLTITASVANPNGQPSAGDSATITGNGCKESDGAISGSLGLAINSLSGNYNSDYYTAGITLAFNNLTITSTQLSAHVNGSLALAVSANGYNNLNQTFSAPSLSVSATYSGETRTRTLTGFRATAIRTPDTTYAYVTRYNVSGAVTSSALGSQTISFNTTTTLAKRSNDSYPSSGVLTISGAGNSQLRLTALSSSQVRQELDANGDGTFEGNTTVSWSSLQ